MVNWLKKLLKQDVREKYKVIGVGNNDAYCIEKVDGIVISSIPKLTGINSSGFYYGEFDVISAPDELMPRWDGTLVKAGDTIFFAEVALEKLN